MQKQTETKTVLPKKPARKKQRLTFRKRAVRREKTPNYVAVCFVCGHSLTQRNLDRKKCKYLRFNFNVDRTTHVDACTDAWVCATCMDERLGNFSCAMCNRDMFDAGIACRCRKCFNEDDAYNVLKWGGLEKSVSSLMQTEESPFTPKAEGIPSYAQLADSWEPSWRILTLLQMHEPLIDRYKAHQK